MNREHDQTKGPGTVGQALVFLYGFFAVAAGARSLYQLATRFDEAPFAILLSVTAAAVYVVAFRSCAGATLAPGASPWRASASSSRAC